MTGKYIRLERQTRDEQIKIRKKRQKENERWSEKKIWEKKERGKETEIYDIKV